MEGSSFFLSSETIHSLTSRQRRAEPEVKKLSISCEFESKVITATIKDGSSGFMTDCAKYK